jgi:hypothetical protein
MSTEKRTEYAVARGNEIVTDWSPNVGKALMDLSAIQNGMAVAHLEPDVHVVESDVEITTKRSRAKSWEDPSERIDAYGQPLPVDSEDGTDGAGIVLGDSGVWGGESVDGVPVLANGAPGDAAAQAAANVAAAQAGGTIVGEIPGSTRVAYAPGDVDNSLPADAPELAADYDGNPRGAKQGTGRSRSKSTGGDAK